MGGTDGCWLYDGAKHEWRRLEGPKEVETVRVPLEKLRERDQEAWRAAEARKDALRIDELAVSRHRAREEESHGP
jgi:flagellar biosynthesis chaperone FliJ